MIMFSREYYDWLISDVRRDLWYLDDDPARFTPARRAALRIKLNRDLARLTQYRNAAPLSAEFDGMQ